MARLIEIEGGEVLPERLQVRIGDVLVFDATGAHLASGSEHLELIGSFVRSVVGGGSVLSPMGGPNAVLARAIHPGLAHLEIVLGDAWTAPRRRELLIVVEDA